MTIFKMLSVLLAVVFIPLFAVGFVANCAWEALQIGWSLETVVTTAIAKEHP